MRSLTEELKKRLDKIKLLALDLDGTTLTDDKKIIPEVSEAIAKAKHAGYHISFLTGRMFAAAAPFANALELDIPIVSLNGTVIAESRTGKILYEKTLSHHCVRDILTVFDGAPVHKFIYEGDNIRHKANDPEILKYLELWAVNINEVKEFDLESYRKIYQILLVGETNILDKIAGNLNGETKCDITTFGFPSPRYPLNFLEIKSTGDSKGKGLKFLREYYELSQDQVLAVGDYLNDYELFNEAGLSIAVANATDGLKERADLITDRTNEEGAVAEVIDMLLDNGNQKSVMNKSGI
ncbi:HAD family hydrolase [Candidatus Marinimicrobia bacterium MT.SAG.3]|nr:HAD family hydrolase [Candidatus Marinimicrobia bacterium MT.SAG.3]